MDKLAKIHNQADAAISNAVSKQYSQQKEMEIAFLLGGIDVVNVLTTNLQSALIRKIQRIRDDQIYLGSGFTRFDDFLDKHPLSPMSYKKFNELEKFLEQETPPLFDLLQGSGLSVQKRKALQKAGLSIEDDKLVAYLPGDETPTEIAIDNERMWVHSLKTIIERLESTEKRLKKHDEQAASKELRIRELYQENDRLRASKAADMSADPHMMAVIRLEVAFNDLKLAVENLSPVERQQFAAVTFEKIADRCEQLRLAYGTGSVTAAMPKTAAEPGTEEDFINSLMDQVEAEDDAESGLAAAM